MVQEKATVPLYLDGVEEYGELEHCERIVLSRKYGSMLNRRGLYSRREHLFLRKSQSIRVPPSFVGELRNGAEDGSTRESFFEDEKQWMKNNYEPNEFPLQLQFVQMKANTLVGFVQVSNWSWEKDVWVRYSVNSWKNFHECIGSYLYSVDRKNDIFRFEIHLEHLKPPFHLEFAVCYRTVPEGKEFWDNNFHKNYKVTCENESTMC